MDPTLSITLLEIIGIHIYSVYSCSKKKWSSFVTILLLCVITATITAVLYPTISWLSREKNGIENGLFLLLGFFYILPVKFLFDQSLKHTAIIMFTSNIYAVIVFALTCRINVYLSVPNKILISLILQSVIFIITMPVYHLIIKKKLRYILKSLQEKMINYILIISFLYFFVIFFIHYILVEGGSIFSELLLLAFIILSVILCYSLAYQLVLMHKEANDLSRITRIDSMTKLKNRKGLYEDVVALVENEVPFSIIYIDLDHFKKVNDSYGHATGDAYLLEFVNAVRKVLGNEEHFYRLHGDEFVIISEGPETETLCNTIENLRFQDPSDHMEFRGASTGCALFPKDGDTLNDLLYMADFNMYTNKKERHTSIAQ